MGLAPGGNLLTRGVAGVVFLVKNASKTGKQPETRNRGPEKKQKREV
jgi:hypothetical protein